MRHFSFLHQVLGGAFIFVFFASSSDAALIVLDDPNFAASTDGFNITRDMSTGLDWLDLDVSEGRTFADVSGEFGAGGDFEGFRYATETELHGQNNGPQFDSLFKSAGISGWSFSSIGSYPIVLPLLDVIGCFGDQCASSPTPGVFGYAYGTILDVNGLETAAYIEAFESGPWDWGGAGLWPSGYTPRAPNPSSPVYKGNFLVRASASVIPIPAAVWLFGSGLGLLGWMKRRNQS